jgi:hypothetical protein
MTDAKDTRTPPSHDECGVFPDIYEAFVAPKNLPDEQKHALQITTKFGFPTALPDRPEHFATAALAETDRIKFAAIYGLMLVRNMTDPEVGQFAASSDDVVLSEEWDVDHKRFRFIARRFVEAVVDAVQEYTSRAGLFQRVYGFLKAEQRGNRPASGAAQIY